MLDIDSSINIDPGVQKFLHILITLGMTAALGIGMRQFIYQDQPRFPLQRTVNIKLPEGHLTIKHLLCGNLFKSLQESRGLRSGMRFNIPGNHVGSICFRQMRCLQHGIGFSYACGITKENLQLAPLFTFCIISDRS